jgi:hypothetical protein
MARKRRARVSMKPDVVKRPEGFLPAYRLWVEFPNAPPQQQTHVYVTCVYDNQEDALAAARRLLPPAAQYVKAQWELSARNVSLRILDEDDGERGCA